MDGIAVTIIHCWSAPRSRSTALLYSFESNNDCIAIDEPLYRRWLQQKGDLVERPYTEDLIYGTRPKSGDASLNTTEEQWNRERPCLSERIRLAIDTLVANHKKRSSTCTSSSQKVIFLKHMAKHNNLYNFDKECEVGYEHEQPTYTYQADSDDSGDEGIAEHVVEMVEVKVEHKHILLIRDPVAILSSWDDKSTVHGNAATSDEVGIVQLLSIYSAVSSRPSLSTPSSASSAVDTASLSSNNAVIILDSDDLSANPSNTLQQLCQDVHIPYTDGMLTWKSGPHECDGPWAHWWYKNVHNSTGWGLTNDVTKTTTTSSSFSPVTSPNNSNSRPTSPTTIPNSPTNQNNNNNNNNNVYRTMNPKFLPALQTSMPAYNHLKSLTHGHQQRGPKPSKIYEDPRNEHVLIYIGAPGRGRLLPRYCTMNGCAGISPWDSSVQGGDATWEGIRVYRGKIMKLERHLDRLIKSAKALGFYLNTTANEPGEDDDGDGNYGKDNAGLVHSREEIKDAIFRTLAANGMRDGAHMRLTLTRGEKCTSSMNPKFNVYGTTLIILPEWKPTEGATTYDNEKGISLVTSSTRRNSPSTCDSKIHHNNMINNILPKIQANLANAEDAIMLDIDGFVSETNATNIFMVDNGVLLTPHADHCLPGITRETILILAKEMNIPTEERRISLAEFHAADEVFTTGTMGELTPVTMIDGRIIGPSELRGPMTERLQYEYSKAPDRVGWATEIPQFV